jgi:hypothetical protein
VLTSPAEGEVIWPAAKAAASKNGARDRLTLASWSGAPLDESNRGAWLDEGTLVCQIGDSSRLSAMLTVDQSDIEFVAPGQSVVILFASLPGERSLSRIDRVATVERASDSKAEPGQTVFQASAPIDDRRKFLSIGAAGKGKIRVGSQTVAVRLWRELCGVFQFEL